MPRSKPLTVGLTGGIGAGKSIVARIFSILGVPIFDSDREGKRLLAEDEGVRAKVVQLFGDRAYTPQGPDRAFLAEVIFSDADKRTQLNSIIHPAVRASFEAFVARHKAAPFVINEAAILIETGGHESLDTLIVVTAPEELRIARVRDRDGVGSDGVRKRMQAQWPQEKKVPYADFVIENDNVKPVIPVVLQVFNTLKRSANAAN